ncbi:GNAT family N-acetyltransferase [Radiobacillus sp. PE A8.2]|uniref:GNAT family N-acetyltransferase n=1 Tax=Radiobacillus sp. PE A8.2 TaxID=3380349 RepID=UPI003890E4DB
MEKQITFPYLTSGKAYTAVAGTFTASTFLLLIRHLFEHVLLEKSYRGQGIGTALLQVCHQRFPHTRLEMLATSASKDYYEKLGFRAFYGFRKTMDE